eukprot:10897247-Ditylum_brightwellii.AAC.1
MLCVMYSSKWVIELYLNAWRHNKFTILSEYQGSNQEEMGLTILCMTAQDELDEFATMNNPKCSLLFSTITATQQDKGFSNYVATSGLTSCSEKIDETSKYDMKDEVLAT